MYRDTTIENATRTEKITFNNKSSGADPVLVSNSTGKSLNLEGSFTATDGTQSVILSNTGSLELVKTTANAFIDFKSSSAEDFDCRIGQASNGLNFHTGGDGATVLGLSINSSQDIIIPNGDLDLSGNFIDNVLFLNDSSAFPATTGEIRLGIGNSIGWRNNANDNNHELVMDTNDDLVLRLDGVAEYLWSSTKFRLIGNNLEEVGGTTDSTQGGIRIASNVAIGWRNNGNDADILINANSLIHKMNSHLELTLYMKQ